MKIYIDGFGLVAEALTNKLINIHGIRSENIKVNTYKIRGNFEYINFLQENSICHDVASYCDKYNEEINNFEPDYIFSFYGRRIIPSTVLKMARKNAINLHPSLLPNYKGCFSSVWMILNNEEFAGITFHEMIDRIDAGKILLQKKINVNEGDTAYSLYHKLMSKFIIEFDDFFRGLINNAIVGNDMPIGGAYYRRSLPNNGIIDMNWSDDYIEKFIKAMHFPPYAGAKMLMNSEYIEIDTFEQFLKFKKI